MKKLSTKQKWLLGLAIAAVGIFLFSRWKKTQTDTTNKGGGIPEKSGGGFATYQSDPLPSGFHKPSSCMSSDQMKRGDACVAVLNIQRILNENRSTTGIEKLVEDGLFGSATEKAVQKVLGKKTAAWTDLAAKFD